MADVDIPAVLEFRPDLFDDDADPADGAQLRFVGRKRISDLEPWLERDQLTAQDGRDLPDIGDDRGTTLNLSSGVVGRRDSEKGVLFTDCLP